MQNNEEIKKVYEEIFFREKRDLTVNETDRQWLYLKLFIDEYCKEKGLKKEEAKILDACCGTGKYMKKLEGEGINNIQGVDLFNAIPDKAINYVSASIANMPFQNQAFDIIYCSTSLYYMPDPEEGIKEFWRCLKEGGMLYLSVTTKYSVFTLQRILGHFLKKEEYKHIDYYHFKRSVFAWKRLLENNAFNIKWIDGYNCMTHFDLLKEKIGLAYRFKGLASNTFAGIFKALFSYHAIIVVTK